MKIKLILLLTVFLALSSCWTPDYVEDAKVAIEVGKQQLIPYQKDQKINFIHSKGYAFDFTVTQTDLKWDSLQNEDCTPDFSLPKTIHYTTYQTKTVTLQSEYPNIGIRLSMRSSPDMAHFISVRMNSLSTNLHFDKNYQFVPDTNLGNSILHESITINGKTYDNVIEAKMKGDKDYSDMSVLYNELGLLQIKISDDETFSINN